MGKAIANPKSGLYWTDRKRLTDLDFADEIAVFGKTCQKLQEMAARLEEIAAKLALWINIKKTEVMRIETVSSEQIKIQNTPIEEFNQFVYVGCITLNEGNTELDVNCRVGKTTAIFQRMRHV